MKSLLFLVLVAAAVAAHDDDGYIDEDTDAYVIEAATAEKDDLDGSPFAFVQPLSARQSRQLFHQQALPQLPIVPILPPGFSPIVKPQVFQPCYTRDGRQGNCTSVKSCYPYFKLFDLQPDETWVMGSYDTCSYNGPAGRSVIGVCCAEAAEIPPETEEEKEEEEEEEEEAGIGGFPVDFQQINDPGCGQRNFRNDFRIINGQIASVNEFPFMAAMLNKNRQFCGGSLVDDIHILTAAHCVAHMSKYDVQNLRIVLGDHNLKQTGETRGQVQQLKVKRVIRHKGFDSSNLWNDVAILTLEKPVTQTNTVRPICLADTSDQFVGNMVQVAGWGTTKAGGGRSSDVLQKVDVRVWSNSQCKSSYGSDAPGGIQDHMICASLPEAKQDSCSGDSGGPLFHCNHNRDCIQMGVVSWGIGCARAEYPGVYTRVTSLLPWIKKIAKKY